jgi:hypothetical protein
MLTGPLIAGLAGAAAMLVVRRDRAIALLVVLAIAWLALVAYMTSDGFSGNQRYLIAPAALLIVIGGAGAGWALEQLLALLHRAVPRVVPRHIGHVAIVATALVVGAGFAGPSFHRFGPTMRNLEYQADLANELPGLIAQAGGADAVKRCGDPYTGPFLVPVVAWNLRVHTEQVQLAPQSPAVVFRVKTTEVAPPGPSLRDVGQAGTLATGTRWRILGACGSGTS